MCKITILCQKIIFFPILGGTRPPLWIGPWVFAFTSTNEIGAYHNYGSSQFNFCMWRCRCTRYNLSVIKYVCDWPTIWWFSWVFWFPPPNKLTTLVQEKYFWMWNWTHNFNLIPREEKNWRYQMDNQEAVNWITDNITTNIDQDYVTKKNLIYKAGREPTPYWW